MEIIETANQTALKRMLKADVVLVDVQPAKEVIPGLGDHVILHAGPPVAWTDMCGPMQGAICGAAVLEGWARDLETAEAMASAGEFTFHPNHHFGAGIARAPMACFEQALGAVAEALGLA